MKVVRELGLERRETVRFLSAVLFLNKIILSSLVREDRDDYTACVELSNILFS